MGRIYNFNPGPSALPLEALQTAQNDLLDYNGLGISVMEMSHRSKDFDAILQDTKKTLRKLINLPDNYNILFLGGGASLQFAMIPMNFLSPDQSADYINTGSWSGKAIAEAKLFGKVNIAVTSEEAKYTFVPSPEQLKLDPNAAYVHLTSNNTIFGTQWHYYPDTGNVPLIVDMSSDILSRNFDVKKMAMIYAGAQKNIGPAGVTLVIIRDDLLERVKDGNPRILNYKTHIEKDSAYNTPPVFNVYMVRLFLKWIESIGGLDEMEKINKRKKDMIYDVIDQSDGFYKGTVREDSRSWMNATLRMHSEDLEATFVTDAKASGFIGLKGHRSVGGIRVSMYNGVTLEAVEKLAEFMKEFRKKH